MTLLNWKATGMLLVVSAALTVASCKGKEEKQTDSAINSEAPANMDTITTTTMPAPAPGESRVSEAQLKDATKDFPGVTATVNGGGEVTLTGTIKRDRLPMLMQSVQALQPTKVNNNLTIE